MRIFITILVATFIVLWSIATIATSLNKHKDGDSDE